MKLTKKQLRQIIKEEVSILSEQMIVSKEDLLKVGHYTNDAVELINWMKSQGWEVTVNDDGTVKANTGNRLFHIQVGRV